MKIVIHGTKGGYHTFTPDEIKFFDVRPDYNKVAAIGEYAYAIHFKQGDVVFTKYKIIRDVKGDKRTGNIGFSILLSANESLKGVYIKDVLDKLYDYYCKEHIQNNNLDNVKEDWSFVRNIQEQYLDKITVRPTSEIVTAGLSDPAYLYYQSETEDLPRIFENPFQEEYYKYKQVFFVSQLYKGKNENPLNALKHDPLEDLTRKIDFENEKYYLKEFHGNGKQGVEIDIWSNDRKRINGDAIFKKDQIRVRVTKKYHEPIDKVVKLTDPDIDKFFQLEGNKIKVNAIYDLKKEERTFEIFVTDANHIPIKDSHIFCRGKYGPPKQVNDNSVIFLGEELKDPWIIYAKKGDNLVSKDTEFIPEKLNGRIDLVLEKRVEVKFEIQDLHANILYNFQIYVKNKNIKPGESKVVFWGNEVENSWEAIVSHEGYDTKTLNFFPNELSNPKLVNLAKSQKGGKAIRYNVEPGRDGKLNSNLKITTYQKDGSDVKQHILPNKGYRFSRFVIKDGNILEAKYEKTPVVSKAFKVFIIAAGILLIVFISLGIRFGFLYYKQVPQQAVRETISQAKNYTQGNELDTDTLEYYKKKFCTGEVNSTNNKKSNSWWPFSSSAGNKEKNDAVTCGEIGKAISLRNAINLGKIDQIKGNAFSGEQGKFKMAINNIEPNYKNQIGDTLNHSEVSKMNLNEIADLIIRVQDGLKAKVLSEQQENQAKKSKSENNVPQKSTTIKKEQDPTKTHDYIKSLPVSTVEKEFWSLVHSGNTKKDDYDKLLEKYSKSQGEIVIFLKKICGSKSNFNQFKEIDEIVRKKATTLKDIDKDLQK